MDVPGTDAEAVVDRPPATASPQDPRPGFPHRPVWRRRTAWCGVALLLLVSGAGTATPDGPPQAPGAQTVAQTSETQVPVQNPPSFPHLAGQSHGSPFDVS